VLKGEEETRFVQKEAFCRREKRELGATPRACIGSQGGRKRLMGCARTFDLLLWVKEELYNLRY